MAVEYELLSQTSNESKIDNLFNLYKKDPYKARVLYMNDTTDYERFKLVVFKGESSDFDIVCFVRKFGISKTNRIYNSEKRLLSIKYKDGRFWLVKGRQLLTMTLDSLRRHMDRPANTDILLTYLMENGFSWIRFMREKHIMTNTAFNSIIDKKVYSYKKALRHIYKIPAPQAKLIHEGDDGTRYNKIMGSIVHYLGYLENVEALRDEWIKTSAFNLFYDTLRMAKTTGNKVNCSWSDKRLKLEHDKWAEIITDVIYIDGDRPLIIKDMYIDFEEFSGFKLLRTTKEMAIEGKRQNHCVASYINKVDTNKCAIYHVKGFTLELGRKYNKKGGTTLSMLQFRGIGNSEPDSYLVEEVEHTINEFVRIHEPFKSNTVNTTVDYESHVGIGDIDIDDLPF